MEAAIFCPFSARKSKYNMRVDRTVLITGASSGFGLRTAVTLAGRGWRVIATMRDVGRAGQLEEKARAAGVWERIEILPLDVTDLKQIEELAGEIAARPEPLDAVVNNAGFAMAGFADDVSDAELRRQFDVNFFGAAAVTRAFLPQMRRQGFGHVVMVASISGRTGYPGVSSYAASKFALEGWTETLRFEMAPLGIQVALVEPGSYATEIWTRGAVFAEGSKDPASPNAARQARLREAMQARPGKGRGNPQEVAEGIARILEDSRPPLRTVFGRDAKLTLAVRTLLPWRWWERLVVRMSGLGEK
jgi:NAD(P)-dependent dehydrogenase (short-subunit alcohol dehydrogenase family)